VSARRVAAGALLATLALATPLLAAATTSVNLPAKLAPEVARARTAGAAVLIPASIPADVAASRLYASGGATTTGYDIQLAYAPGCMDATACFFAEFQAGRQLLLSGTRVALHRAISGRFEPIRCGASCAPASIGWQEGGVRYNIQYVAGDRASMVALADSAIDGGPR
jgi:hypothetical protein